MAGWNLKFGELKDNDVSDDRYWSLFNFVFSYTVNHPYYSNFKPPFPAARF